MKVIRLIQIKKNNNQYYNPRQRLLFEKLSSNKLMQK